MVKTCDFDRKTPNLENVSNFENCENILFIFVGQNL